MSQFLKVLYGGGERKPPVDSGRSTGRIYAITENGQLLWYRDDNRQGGNGPNAERGWANNSGNAIGRGWQNFRHVFSDAHGVIYAITADGRLLWYQDELGDGLNGPDAATGWAANSGAQIGVGWQNFAHVFASCMSDGVIYAVTTDGRLLWYRDDDRSGRNGPNGESGWAVGSGNQIGVGWQSFTKVIGYGNVIYAISPDGRLLWYQDDDRAGQNGPNGERGWAAGSGNQIGIGWQDFAHVFPGGHTSSIGDEGFRVGNIIYGVTSDGRLRWYRDDDRTGRNGPQAERGWESNSGAQIGIGW